MVVLVFVFLIFAIAGLQLFSGLLQNSCYDAQTSRPYVNEYGNAAVLCTKNSCPVIPGQELICGKNSQNPDFGTSSFDDLPSSFLMVYVVTTLEGWTQIMYYVQETFNYWLSLYFLLVVFIAAFFLINLTLAVITIKFNESQDESKVEELARAKHENDDFFKILPLPAFPRVKNTFKEGISLTRMRANKDFNLLKITKFDTIERPFKEIADPTVTVQAYKEIKQRSRVEMRKYEVQTFDNTQDWRKMKGDLFTGDVMKKAIQIYTPTTKAIENEWLKRSATNVAKPAHKNQIVPIHSSSRENLKQSLPKLTNSDHAPGQDGPDSTYHTLANFVPVANLRGFDLEDAKSEVEIHLQELVNMTTMNPSELTRYCNSLAKKQAQEKLKAAASMDFVGDRDSPIKGARNTVKPTLNLGDASPKKVNPQGQGQRFLDSIQENDFGLSDDEEDKHNIPKDVKKLTALIMANNKVRLYLRRFVRRWKKNHYHKKEKAYDTFNDLRQDEDFMNVAGVKLMGAIKEKPKAPVVANPIKKTPEINKKGGPTTTLGQQPGSPSKEALGPEAIKPAEKPNQESGIADQLAKADNAAAATKKTNNGDAKDPANPVVGDNPDSEVTSKPKDEFNLDEKSLLNNEAFQGLVDVLKNEGLKRFDDTAKKEAKKQKKKKKVDNEDEEGQKKQNPEWIEEEALLKYYQGKNYQNLKLEAAYKYNIIPSPAFSSIFDILPDHTKAAKHRVMMEMESGKGKGKKAAAQAADKSAPKLEIEYTMVELKQAASKKKKKKPSQAPKNTSSAGGLDSSSKLQSSSGMSDESGELSAYSSDDQGNHNRIMSEIKEKRIRWLETNEKYIIQKPFPLLASQRKDRIFSHMSYDPYMAKGMAASSLTGMSSVTSGSKRDKNKGVDYGDEFETVNEMFKTDLTNDKKDLKEYKVAENKPDYTVLYQKVQAMDSVEGKIVRFNWSGNQVVATRQFTLSQTFKTLDSLNKRVLEIWMQNYSGLWATIRRYFRETVENSSVNLLLMVCVFLNTLMMASDGLTPDSWAPTFSVLNYVFVSIFAVESFLKIVGYPFNVFAKDAFNVFDAIVVCISFVEVGINASSSGDSSGGNAASAFRAVRIFRIFRVLRVTRLLRSLRFMKVIIEVIKGTLEQFAYIAVLLFLFIFIFTLLGTQVFGGQFKFMKATDRMRFNWDTFQNGFYTTFDVLTMENWNNVLVNVLRSETNAIISLIYLLAWIFIGNYIFLNLFLAILLDGFESSDALTMVEELDTEAKELTATYQRLVKEIKEKARNEENS